MSAHYTQLPSQSTAQLPLYTSSESESPSSSARATSSNPSPTLHAPRGHRDDEKGLLGADGTRLDTTDEEEEEAELLIKSHSPRSWSDRLPFRPRTVLFSLLSLSILISLFLFFHPSKPLTSTISHDSSSYYSGAPLSIGLYDPSLAQLAPNPLEQDATFSDVPFAKVGGSWSDLEKGWKPEWAGGKGDHSIKEEKEGEGRFSNGTNWFEKTVILVTIEGMRTDYLSKEVTPNLFKLSNEGFKAESLKPVFPSLSAPNHWSILTGLYPSSHGIVSNKFTTVDGKVFDASLSTANQWDPYFYQGEPIYRSALASSLKVATLMHPLIPPLLASSSPHPSPSKPTYWYPPILKHTHPKKKLEKVLQFLDLNFQKRPQLILTNFQEVLLQVEKSGTELVGEVEGEDEAGVGVGVGVGKALKMIDESFFGSLEQGLKERGLEDWVEIVVVGVTGMKNVEKDRVLVLDEILDKETFDKLSQSLDGGSSTVVGLNMKFDETSSREDESNLLHQLETASKDGQGGFSVYTRDNLPEEWHFSLQENDRIAPIWLVAQDGWTIATRAQLEEMGGKLSFKATNGYDSREMDTIFISKGPYTKSILERKVEKDRSSFSNLEVYEFVANTLGLPIESRALNNGTKGFWE
ncbi:hypothetical protein JCM3765_002352 [Sporobolomyces pararoseus]